MARLWPVECQKSHSSCIQIPSELPSRILAISRHRNQDIVRLQCSTNEDHAPYAFLSYRRGGPQHRVLTRQALHTYQNGICVKDLPPTFQEAVTVARDLCLQYLYRCSLYNTGLAGRCGCQNLKDTTIPPSSYSRHIRIQRKVGTRQIHKSLKSSEEAKIIVDEVFGAEPRRISPIRVTDF